MKIAIVSRNDVYDVRSWSGTDYYTFHTLKKEGKARGVDIHVIDKLNHKRNRIVVFFEKIHARLYRMIFRKSSCREYYRSAIKSYAKLIQKELPYDVDVIFSMSSWPITYLKSTKIKIFYSDADIGDYINLYPSYKNLSEQRKKMAIKMREDAINNCDLVLFSSEWAAKGTISRYGITDTSKIRVVPFGANIECTRNKADIEKIIENKRKDVCNLLFIGVDWVRKGGKIALETANILHGKGVNVHLDIVGIKNCPDKLPQYVENHGFVLKSTEDGRVKMDNLYKNAHFFILPTMADCTPIVLYESSSFGLPAISTNIGGVASIITDNKNGKLFELSDNAEKYAEYIQATLANYENYKKLCVSSFEQYETHLNWKVSGEKILAYIEEVFIKNKDKK